MKRYFVIIMALLLLLSACAGQNDIVKEKENTINEEEISITVCYPGDDSSEVAIMEELCMAFMEKHSSIQIIMLPSAKGIYTENLKVKVALGEMPDILQIENPYSFAKAGILGEIPYAVSSLVKNPVNKGQPIYALPIYTRTYGIIYNKVLFENHGLEVPKTYDEFLLVCEALKNVGIAPIALGGSKTEHLSYWLNYFYQIDVVQNNQSWQLKRNMGKVSFAEEPAQTMLENYLILLDGEYVLEDSINMNDNQLVSSIVEGKAAMVYAGPWLFAQIVAQDAEATDFYEPDKSDFLSDEDFRLGWFFMPDREGNPIAMEITAMNWAISKECEQDVKRQEAATLFLKFFYEKENYRKALQAVNGLPTTKEAVLYPMIGAQQKLMVSYRYAKKSNEYIGNYLTPEEFLTTLYPTLDSLITGTISLETGTKRLDEEWESPIWEER